MAKPAFMKMTRMVAISNQRLLARKAALISGSAASIVSWALAARLNRPKPIKLKGTQANQASRLREPFVMNSVS